MFLRDLVSVAFATLAIGTLAAGDPFCDGSCWQERASYENALTLTFGGDYRGRKSLVVSNAFSRGSDTAWRVVSVRRPVPAEGRHLRIVFRAAADWPVRKMSERGSWCTAVRWYDAAGKRVSRTVLPGVEVGRRFSRIVHTVERPMDAVACEIEFGFDEPNVPPGKCFALNSLGCRFFRDDPPEDASDSLELREPEIRFTAPADACSGFSFAASDASGLDWSSLEVKIDGADATSALVRDGDRVVLRRPASPWTDGLHRVEIRLADKVENMAVSEKFFFIGRPPSGVPDCRLRKDGMALVDGKPFFPIGIYGVCPREFNAYDLDRACADLKAGSFNTVHSYSESRNPAFAAAARKHGLMSWCEFRTPDRKFMDFQRDDASCLARYTGDDTADNTSPSVMLDRHENAKALDPGRLTAQADPILSRDSPRSRYREYVNCSDVFMPEIYPIREDDADAASNCVARVIRDMELARRDIAEAGGGVTHGIWPIIQYFKGWGWKRFPTRTELFAMSFAAIVHGANGLTFYTYGGFVNPERKTFNYGVTTSAERWTNVTNLAARVAFLSPALLSEDGGRLEPKVLTGPGTDPLGLPSVSALFRRWRGEAFLIAVNSSPAEVRASFALPKSGALAAEAEVLWENRHVRIAQERLEDAFGPFAVHAYRWK